MSRKKDAEPLKLMPLDEFGKLVNKIAQVPKKTTEAAKPPKKRPKAKRPKRKRTKGATH